MTTTPSHAHARGLATEAYHAVFGHEPSACEVTALCAVAWLETLYGAGWGEGPGRGSFNMGAITAGSSWTGETFESTDSRFDDVTQSVISYTTRFRVYPTELDGWKDLVQNVFVNNGRERVKARARACDYRGVSDALYDTKYYLGTQKSREANIDAHYKRMLSSLKAAGISQEAPSMGPALLSLGLFGAIVYLTTKKRGQP